MLLRHRFLFCFEDATVTVMRFMPRPARALLNPRHGSQKTLKVVSFGTWLANVHKSLIIGLDRDIAQVGTKAFNYKVPLKFKEQPYTRDIIMGSSAENDSADPLTVGVTRTPNLQYTSASVGANRNVGMICDNADSEDTKD
jgi:hypothetical protein